MATRVTKARDADLDRLAGALARYKTDHPTARITAYRQGSVSLRARIIDPDFAGVDRGQRHEAVWRLIEGLPEDVQSQLSVLLLLTPEEAERSFANVDFDHPIPSDL